MAIPHPLFGLTSLFQQTFFIPPATLTAENLPDLTSHVSLITGGCEYTQPSNSAHTTVRLVLSLTHHD